MSRPETGPDDAEINTSPAATLQVENSAAFTQVPPNVVSVYAVVVLAVVVLAVVVGLVVVAVSGRVNLYDVPPNVNVVVSHGVLYKLQSPPSTKVSALHSELAMHVA